MPLATLTPKSKTISFGDEAFEVHALTVKDFSILVRDHRESLESMFVGGVDMAVIVSSAPEVVQTLIALASQEAFKEAYVGAGTLPMGIQIQAIEAIWGLSIPDPKALMEVINLLSSLMAQD